MYGRNWQRISQHYHNIYTINVYSCELRVILEFFNKMSVVTKSGLKRNEFFLEV